MINPNDKAYQPSVEEVSEYVGNSLFDELLEHMESKYRAQKKFEFSGDNNLPGWNIRFLKSGKTLCRVYPREGRFFVLIIVGRKEKQLMEEAMPQMSQRMQTVYENTREGMGQRWMGIGFNYKEPIYDDLLTIIEIRRKVQ